MTTNEAAQILSEMYMTAPEGDKTTQIHLFGIKYNRDLEGLPIQQIVDQSRIGHTYASEVYKGIRLAKYVEVKAAYR